MARALRNPASWRRVLKRLNVPFDSPEADYDRMREFLWSLNSIPYPATMNGTYSKELKAQPRIAPSLQKRHWHAYVSQKGSFIASDNPVVGFDGEKKEMVGFANAQVVVFLYPLNRHVVLCGARLDVTPVTLSEILIARLNTLMMLTAHEQVFSWKSDFCWLDHSEHYQTDWRLFEKDRFPI